MQSNNQNNKQIRDYLQSLEQRIKRIEAYLNIETGSDEPEKSDTKIKESNDDAIEFRIGELWFSKVGIVVLSIGLAFLLSLSYKNYPAILPSVIGYIITIVLYTISHLFRKSSEYISKYLLGSSLFILFFSTLRLHFFTENPIIENEFLEFFLLIVVVLISLLISLNRRALYITGISIIMAYISALTSPEASVFLKIKYQWHGVFILGIVLTYISHLIWFMNNPVLGNDLHLVDHPQSNLMFIFLYLLVFSFGNYFKNDGLEEDNYLISSTFINCFFAFILSILIVFTRFRQLADIVNYTSFIFFLGLSVIFWIKFKSKYATFFYAMFGYAALSIAIISQFEEHNTFVWLCWQSIVVISTAIWFRSKFIIVTNFFIYLIILLGYVTRFDTFNLLSLSFGITALVSARLLNWQKNKLELRTDYMRNAYLISAFIIFPYTLFKLVPYQYIVISWIGIALLYYVLGRILNNKKYRLMALGTLLLSVLYIFVIGIIQLEEVYRVASFIVLGIVLIITSLIYTQLRKKVDGDNKKV